MYLDRAKLKKVEIEDLEFGTKVYEDNQGLIIYIVDRTFNIDIANDMIPLMVISDPNGYFVKNALVYRNISKLLKE